MQRVTSSGTDQQPAESLSLHPQRAEIDENVDERGSYHRCVISPGCLLVTCINALPLEPPCDYAHRRLLAAAKDGRSDDAEAVLREMAMAGLEPGPRAYHGLICAYCRAQDSQGALSAVRRAVQEGGQPL